MCGEIEAESPLEEQILAHFSALARSYLQAARESGDGGDGEAPAHGYMDKLFAAVLGKCAGDIEEAGEKASLEQLRAQSIVLARLSGILAGQLPPEAETLPAAMDALLVGYRETEGQSGHDHGHDHHH